MGNFYGLKTEEISNGILSLEYLLDAGPRIVRLVYKTQGDNLLAEIPDREHQSIYGTYYFRGGHRLWHAPEDIERTYIPDNHPITVSHSQDGVTLIQPIEPVTGIQKSIRIELTPYAPRLAIHHNLFNHGVWPVELSGWAITQFPLGGMAILPQTKNKVDANGLWPNRNLSLWPYASITDPRLTLADDLILIEAYSLVPPLKIGYANRMGWIGYYRNSILFIKHFSPLLHLPHPDFNCNVEVYCGNEFIELETLSPFAKLAPGESICHTETWELIPDLTFQSDLNDIRNLIKHASLDE